MDRDVVPQLLTDTTQLDDLAGPGAVWRLEVDSRDLDANLIALRPGDDIEIHDGPDLDVLIHVVAGSGHLQTATGTLSLGRGIVAWLPRGSRRGFLAGPSGLHYLTVHRRRHPSALTPTLRRHDT